MKEHICVIVICGILLILSKNFNSTFGLKLQSEFALLIQEDVFPNEKVKTKE